MNDWQREQRQTLAAVRHHLGHLPPSQQSQLRAMIDDYVVFRDEVAEFQRRHILPLCAAHCFQNRLSACCGRDAIVVFFAEVVINALLATPAELDHLAALLSMPHSGSACLYLGAVGCQWRLKPLVCEMFLCDEALGGIEAAGATDHWQALRRRETSFRWPDRPVLFDRIEAMFLDAGCHSPLMYLHTSPGLLRVKRRSGQCPPSGP